MALIAAPPLAARRPFGARGRSGVADDRTRVGTVRRWFTDVTTWISDLFLIISLVAFLGLALGPRLFDYRTESMITGSMAPLIKPGDVIVIKPVAAQDLKAGDVISYQVPVADQQIVTHRVVSVDRTAVGGVTFRTKGDANESIDPWTAQVVGNRAWTVRTVVPGIGHAIRWLRDPYVSRLMRMVVPWFLVLSTLQFIWTYGRTQQAGPRTPARPLSRSLPEGVRNPYAVSVYPRPGRKRSLR